MLSLPFPATDIKTLRIVLLGVGNELQGDDAAGLLVIRAIERRLDSNPAVLILEGGVAPENFTANIRRFCPDVVIFLDAADMGAEPGTVQLIPLDRVDGFSASSHIQPLSVLSEFIIAEMGCRVEILGIQAQTMEMGAGVSEMVRKAAFQVADELIDLFSISKPS